MRGTRRGLLLTLLAASACSVGPNYHAPELPVPPAFVGPQAPGAAIDPTHWWTAFGDPTLTSLVERALADNPDIAVAASRVRAARAQEIAARAIGLPTLDATGNVTRVDFSKNAGFSSLARQFGGGSAGIGGTGGGTGGSGTGGSGTGGGVALPGGGITTYAIGFDASWELDIFGGGRRGVEAALARTDAAEWNKRDAAVTLAAEVAQAYFALRLDQAQTAVVTGEIARQQRALDIAYHIAQVGLVPQVDVTRQRATLTATEARLEPIRADIDLRIHALGTLLAQSPAALTAELTAPTTTPTLLPAIPPGLPSDLLRRRPDVRAAERNLAAATAAIGVAVADLYPRFSLTGMAELISSALHNLIDRDSLQTTANGAVSFPLIDFGRRRSQVKVAREEAEQTYQTYRTTVLTALKDVEDALSQLAAEQRRNAILRSAVTDRETTARAVESQYRTGLVAQDSLLNAETDVLTARENLAQSDAQLRQYSAALFKALGGGWDPATPADEPQRAWRP